MVDRWLRFVEKWTLCTHLFTSVHVVRNQQSRKDLAPVYFPSGTRPCQDPYNETSKSFPLLVPHWPLWLFGRDGAKLILRKTDVPWFASYPTLHKIRLSTLSKTSFTLKWHGSSRDPSRENLSQRHFPNSDAPLRLLKLGCFPTHLLVAAGRTVAAAC